MIDPKAEVAQALSAAIAAALPAHAGTTVVLERPKSAAYGDYASNVALALAKEAKRNPRELASAIVAALPASKWIERAEVAGAGFINVTLTPAARQSTVKRVLTEGAAYGKSRARSGERVMVDSDRGPRLACRRGAHAKPPADGVRSGTLDVG